MENVLIQGLDDVLENVKKLKTKYLSLVAQNEALTNQISVLKVEAENYKLELIKVKKESEESVEGSVISVLPTSEIPSEEIEALKKEQKEKNAQIKLQLDGFIEDIDQCIQIIQAKE